MLRETRFEYILNELVDQEMVDYDSLAIHLEVSPDTIRRDIDFLHKNGLLSKVRGGAMKRSRNPLTFQDRDSYLQEEKQIIGLKAQQYIRNGMTLFMDGGTTICTVAGNLPPEIQLRIITTNLMLLPILTSYKNVELVFLGGTYNYQTASTVGMSACSEAASFVADIYFMGTCGVDADFGITAVVKEDAEVKRSMLKSAKRVIALANHDRLRSTEAFKVCDMNTVDVLITDLASTDDALNDFRGKFTELV